MSTHLYKKIDAYIEVNKNRFLAELFTLIRQPSISAENKGMQECAQLVMQLMSDSGIASRIITSKGMPVVYGEANSDEKSTLLVYGHYDVQSVDPIDQWVSPPFCPEIRNGKIYGRGASDNKAQFFLFIKAVEILTAINGKLPINIKFLIEGEEEIGSPSLESFIRSHLELLKADLTLFSDGHIHKSGRPTVTLGVKGMLYVELIAHGAKTDQHSMHATSLSNPAWRLICALNILKNADNKVLIPEFYDDIRLPNDATQAAINAIPDVTADEMFETFQVDSILPGRIKNGYYWNLLTEPTCNIAGLKSGYINEGSKTVLPSSAIAKIDMRLVPDQRPEVILAHLKTYLNENGFNDIEVEQVHQTPPSTTAMEHPALAMMTDSLREVYELEPLVFPRMGGVGPNYVFTEILKQPCFGLPHATFDQANHAPNESMGLDGFFKGLRSTVRILSRMSQALKDN